MDFPIPPRYEASVVRQYETNLSRYPAVQQEVADDLKDKDSSLSLCLKYLYGHMAAQDMLSVSAEVLAGYVRATLEAMKQLEYTKRIPPEVFFPYVLYPRVNSENLDDSRKFLMEELLPHVRGKSMEQAALAVNYWCYAHATYTPADDRTLGPLAVLRRTLGRCGEESVLAVAALRSVGIPARQVYCPRWSHCDDNHAWVEVWIDGDWRYLGACEPEPVLDRGWFTAAASRAMRVDTKEWAGDTLYRTVNCTGRYTNARTLTVTVTEQGLPVANARVCFQIVNYSELYTLWETLTDEQGLARFETGAGDLYVYAQRGQKVALEKADLRLQDNLTVKLRDRFPAQLNADLVPPEDRSGAVPHGEAHRHRDRLSQCEAHLAHRRASFAKEAGCWEHAALNWPEIQAFLEDPRFPASHKEELLSTLRPKDFVDITQSALVDALETSDPARGQYPADIFRNYILAPRIAEEMLLPERASIRRLFPAGFADPSEILTWMKTELQILPDQGVSNHYPSALGCLRYRQAPAFAFDMVFVALCRAFCFPARLDSSTGTAQWLDQDIWRSIQPTNPTVNLTLEFPAGRKLNYFEHFTLGHWNGQDFVTLNHQNLTVEKEHIFCLQPGLYRITASTRQIDGTASVSVRHVTVDENMILQISLPDDQTPQRLKQIPLQLPEGPLKDALNADNTRNLLLIFADPGSEPTEHLLREMLDQAEDFRKLPCRILLPTENPDALSHPTVQFLRSALPEAEILPLRDPDALAALHLQMQVGDLRLPFVVCANRSGQGVYADANYRIRMAQTLLEIQKLFV